MNHGKEILVNVEAVGLSVFGNPTEYFMGIRAHSNRLEHSVCVLGISFGAENRGALA